MKEMRKAEASADLTADQKGTIFRGGCHFAAGAQAAFEKREEALPSYLTKPNGHNAKAWLNGWEFGADIVRMHPATQGGVQADPEGASLFFAELLNTTETLSGIADQYGARTLSDLMYLQNAIASGGFIDHYLGETYVTEIVRQMPSADRWLRYVVRESLLGT